MLSGETVREAAGNSDLGQGCFQAAKQEMENSGEAKRSLRERELERNEALVTKLGETG